MEKIKHIRHVLHGRPDAHEIVQQTVGFLRQQGMADNEGVLKALESEDRQRAFGVPGIPPLVARMLGGIIAPYALQATRHALIIKRAEAEIKKLDRMMGKAAEELQQAHITLAYASQLVGQDDLAAIVSAYSFDEEDLLYMAARKLALQERIEDIRAGVLDEADEAVA